MNKKIFLIGIGGISMSAIAIFLKANGYIVSGSDIAENDNIKMLKKNGITCYIGHNKKNVVGNDFVVFNSAIKEDNEEYLYAKKHGLKIFSRAEILGEIAKRYNHVIAISGTHGKTTTTALIGEIFLNSNLNPTIHIGGIMNKINANYHVGSNDYFITEACEYKNNFHSLFPEISVILNIEEDHLDFFKDYNDVFESFKKFSSHSKFTIINENIDCFYEKNTKKYGKSLNYDYFIKKLSLRNGYFYFDYYEDNQFLYHFKLKNFGEHNLDNSICAISVARKYAIPFDVIQSSINGFMGVKRRYNFMGRFCGATVIHDYAHHPTEITNVIKQAKKNEKVIVVFQPHTYSRTLTLFDRFCKSLALADELILFKTYSAREFESDGKSAYDLYENLKKNNYNCFYANNKKEAKNCLKSIVKEDEIILILGAGDIDEFANEIVAINK